MREVSLQEKWVGHLFSSKQCPCFPKTTDIQIKLHCTREYHCHMSHIRQILLNPKAPQKADFCLALMKTGLFTKKNIASILHETFHIKSRIIRWHIKNAIDKISTSEKYRHYELLEGKTSKILFLRNTDTRKRRGERHRKCSVCGSYFHDKRTCDNKIWKYKCDKI